MQRRGDAVTAMAALAGANPRFVKYDLELLKRITATIGGAPAGSTERHDRRVAALQKCVEVVASGGCTSTQPYELALRLLEIEEEVSAHKAAGVYCSYAGGAQSLGGAGVAYAPFPRFDRVPSHSTSCFVI
jgi:hypothetical protein